MLPEADRHERATEILVSWREERERGDAPGADELIRLHPDLAVELREGIAAYALLDGAFAQMDVSVTIGAGTMTTSMKGAAPFPDRIGDYRIVREIARGGMGIVYEAEQLSMRRRIALKVLYPGVISDPKSVHRFQREAQAAGRLHHTNIVPVYGLGTDGGTWFYAMELVEGRPLNQIVADLRGLEGERNAAAVPDSASATASSGFGTGSGAREEYVRVARAFSGVADALATAHAAGVIHRDVKPANILLDADGTLKVLDFGLARILDDCLGVTKTGDIVGTPAYMSPEQARSGGADARSDVYSLGATMYEVLTRRPPFEGKDVAEVWSQVLHSDPPPPRRWNRRIPRDLETIVVKAMEKDPGRRYATAAEMAHDLLLFAEGAAIRAQRIGPLGRAWRVVRRNRLRSALAAAVLVLGAATGVLLVHRAQHEQRRVDAEYEVLLAEAQTLITGSIHSFGSDGWGRSPTAVIRAATSSLEAAVRLAPDRPEAYLALAITRGEASEQGLLDLSEALERGLPERTYWLVRGHLLRNARRKVEADEALGRGQALPDRGSSREAHMEGFLLLHNNRRKDAIRLFTTALERQRAERGIENPHIRFARSIAREGEGDLEGALEDLAAVRTTWTAANAFFGIRLASLWKRLGRVELAEQGFGRALDSARTAGSLGEYTRLCFATARAGEWLWLERCGRAAIAAHPTDVVGYFALADSFNHRRMMQEAEYWAGEALRVDATNVYALWTRITARFEMNALDAADRDLTRLAELESSPSATTDRMRTMLLFKKGRVTEALDAMRRYALADPEGHEGHHNLAELLVDAGRLIEALPVIERAIETDPSCRRARELKVAALAHAKRFEDALAAVDVAIAALPDGADFRVQRAWILAALGRNADALGEYERAIRADPKSPSAHARFGNALFKAGRMVDALEAFEKALALGATDEDLTVSMANRRATLIHLERYPEALEAIDAELARKPDSGDLHEGRGLILLGLKRYEDSAREYESVARDPARIARITVVVGDFSRAGLPGLARRLAEKAVAQDPPPNELLNFAYLAAIAGRADAGRAALQRLPSDPTREEAYNRACIYALLGERVDALRWLGVAADKGLTLPTADPDPDLVSLADDPAFAAIWKRLTPRR